MQLSDQCSNLELSKKLKSLGVKQQSLCYHVINNGVFLYTFPFKEILDFGGMKSDENSQPEYISAFSVSELVEMLPPEIGNPHLEMYKMRDGKYGLEYICSDWNSEGDTFADACASMLIILIEQKLYEPK